MNKKEMMVKAHKMTKEIKNKYPEVDYKFQLGLCLSYLYEEETKKENEESEINLQINDLSTLVGEKVFVKRNSLNGYTYNDSEKIETFTLDDLEIYSESLIEGEIELQDIEYTNMFKKYYLITFNDLQYVC